MNTTPECRFCARPRSLRQHRAPLATGPICVDCITAGLAAARRGTSEHAAGIASPQRLERGDTTDCESCGRRGRETFFGFRERKLTRVRFPASAAVICRDCLDAAGDLLNRAIRG